MTAPSIPDLAARILAAIELVELAASAATAGPWRHNPNKHWRKPGTCSYEEAVFTGPAGADATCVAGTGPSDHPQAMADARHIALNDPPTVLGRCAADRGVVARHQPEARAEGRLSGFCVHCGWRWPCPDLRGVADAYGLTEDGDE